MYDDACFGCDLGVYWAYKMEIIQRYALATRPWSFTAAVIPILVTAAVLQSSLLDLTFLRAMCLGVAVQAGANLTNTYFDYINGADTKEMAAKGYGDKTLVDPSSKVSATGVISLSVMFYVCALICILPTILSEEGSSDLIRIFTAGLALSFFYTATPVGLKYKALGDVTIFLCFGPLLMQCTALLIQGSTEKEIYLYSIPIGLLTEAILHANNIRDITADKRAKAVTLVTLVGYSNSIWILYCIIGGAYLCVGYISLFYHWGCIAVLVTLPLAVGVCRNFPYQPEHVPEDVAKLHLLFGIIFFLGIKLTETGAKIIWSY